MFRLGVEQARHRVGRGAVAEQRGQLGDARERARQRLGNPRGVAGA
ncbi:MAG: hypothetical protein LC795_20995 [Acidobacteria bacterium]|nr:hypothetical protein [Acidobacteriota bacterium]